MKNEKAEYHLRAAGNALGGIGVGVALVMSGGFIATWWPDGTSEDVIRQYYDSIKADRVPEQFRGKHEPGVCAASKDSFLCNLPKGHAGDHQQVHSGGGVIGWSA